MGRRDVAAMLAVRSGLLRPIGVAIGQWRHTLKVLAYHRVLPRMPEAGFAFDLELVSAWEDDFEWQVAHLARHYDMLTCHDLLDAMRSGRPLPRRAAMITFDDGYADNHDHVLPALQRHGVRGVFFVTTGYIDDPELFWFDRFVHELLRTHSSELPMPDGAAPIRWSADESSRRAAAALALRHLKRVSDAQRRASIDRWRQTLGVPELREHGVNGPMSWAQVRALSDAGMEIGSHSVTHPVLAQVQDDAQLQQELSQSKASIEACTGRAVVSVAYPVGGPGAHSERVIAAVREAGYPFAFTYESGVNTVGAWDALRLRRLHVERYTSRERFAAMLGAPALFA